MRLHRLELTAFGPFRDQQVVDFDALSDAGLFLLTGHTGAGKTSVLDAVTYALYGQVPGGRATSLRIRSDHADASTPTVVQLELTVRSTRLRVRRTPDWDRPKKRGGGMTRERGSVLLERQRAGAWEFVSGRHDEVGHELAGLLGLTHDQFCQVVLLPQGAFASFLVADAESRKRLLERLFGTDRFSAVEAWLSSLRVLRAEAFGQQLDRRNELVARLAEVADDRDRPATDTPDADTLFWADAVLADLGSRRAAATQRAEAAAVESALAESRLVVARETDARHRRLRDLRDRERRLVEAAARHREAETELAAARRALALQPLLDEVDESSEAHSAADRAVEAARATITTLGVAADGPCPVLRGRERELRAEAARLTDLLADAQRLTAITSELREVNERMTATTTDAEEHRAHLGEAPASRARLEDAVRAAQLAGERLPDLEAAATRAADQAHAATTRDALDRHRAAADTARRAAADRVNTARSRSLDLRERRLDGMAAELAAGLRDGAPCPVCGGLEHLRPATASDPVSDEDERAATADLARAEAQLRAAEARVSALAADHAAARAAAGGDHPAAALATRMVEAAARQRAAATEAAGAGRAEAALRDHDELVRTRQRAVQAARDLLREDTDRGVRLRSELTELEGRLTAARGPDPDVPTRVDRLTLAADALDRAATAVTEAEHAAVRRRSAEERLDRAATAAGFVDAAAAALALRSEARMDELADLLAEHDREAAVVAAALAEPDLGDLVGHDPADLAESLSAVTAARAAAAATAGDAQGELGRLDAAHRKALVLHGDLVGAVSRLAPLRADYEAADTLAKLASGTGADNRLRMRLSYYVLSSRLEQVADAASERLLRMSDGRFSLRHTDERAGGNQRSGLGLQVCDGWYGTTREPATLSGGESFMASLALALGLADVVVAEAGGTLMDTLFVDEGFGSLDDETLDGVLEVLDGLRDGGRAVGLVSHVSELRDRIPAQLAVRKAQHGSSLRLSA